MHIVEDLEFMDDFVFLQIGSNMRDLGIFSNFCPLGFLMCLLPQLEVLGSLGANYRGNHSL